MLILNFPGGGGGSATANANANAVARSQGSGGFKIPAHIGSSGPNVLR